MVKNSTTVMLIILLAVPLTFGIIFFGKFLGTGIGDSYATYDDFETPINYGRSNPPGNFITAYSNFPETPQYIATFNLQTDPRWFVDGASVGNQCFEQLRAVNGKLTANKGSQCGNINAQTTRDFKHNNIKITGQREGSTSFLLYLDGRAEPLAFAGLEQGSTFVIEIIPDDLDPDIIHPLINGQEQQQIDLSSYTEWKFRNVFGGSNGAVSINDFKYKLRFSCDIPPQHLLVVQTFIGGQQVDLLGNAPITFQYPVSSFCIDNPIVVTSASQTGSRIITSPYGRWASGQTLTIPQDETWSVFYVVDNSNGIIPTQCTVQQAYNTGTGQCQDPTGIVFLCGTGGVYSNGVCTIQPPVAVQCQSGTLNPEQNTCIVQGVVQQICAIGFYDIASGNCIYNPPIETICAQGTFSNTTGTCQAPAPASCPEGYEQQQDPITGNLVCTFEVQQITVTQAQLICPGGANAQGQCIAPVISITKENKTLFIVGIAVVLLVTALIVFLAFRRK